MKSSGAALLWLALAACGSPSGLGAYGDREKSPSALKTDVTPEAAAARAALDSGDAIGACAILEEVLARTPRDLGLACMLQDAELAAGQEAPALRARYLGQARERDDGDAWVLVARLEGTTAEARSILDRAARLDPANAWAHYGLAFVEARSGFWGEAQGHLKRALELDPGHLAARRLEAALLARDGKYEEARTAYSAWLEASKLDPRVDPAWRLAAQLDLALVELESGHPRAARNHLAALSDGVGQPGLAARRLCLLAASEQTLGRSSQALEAARAAEALAPQSALPKVQQALLHEQWLGDPAAAKAAWERVIGEARTSGDLSDLIQSMRARVVLERLGAASDGAPGPR